MDLRGRVHECVCVRALAPRARARGTRGGKRGRTLRSRVSQSFAMKSTDPDINTLPSSKGARGRCKCVRLCVRARARNTRARAQARNWGRRARVCTLSGSIDMTSPVWPEWTLYISECARWYVRLTLFFPQEGFRGGAEIPAGLRFQHAFVRTCIT